HDLVRTGDQLELLQIGGLAARRAIDLDLGIRWFDIERELAARRTRIDRRRLRHRCGLLRTAGEQSERDDKGEPADHARAYSTTIASVKRRVSGGLIVEAVAEPSPQPVDHRRTDLAGVLTRAPQVEVDRA